MKKTISIFVSSMMLITTILGVLAYNYYPVIFGAYPLLTTVLSLLILAVGCMLLYFIFVSGKMLIDSLDMGAEEIL